MQRHLEDLIEAHSAVIGMLESLLLSPFHRRRLELMRDNLEREIASLKAEQQPEGVAA